MGWPARCAVATPMLLALSLGLSPAAASPALSQRPPWTVEGDQHDGRLGSVAAAGDVNGDGYADVIVGAYHYSHPEAHEGIVLIYLGTPTGLSTAPACTLEVDQAEAKFGDKLSSAGDVNGDGYDDVILGAGQYSDPEFQEGAAFLYMGSAAGLSCEPSWSVQMNQVGAPFASSVARAGDVNHDGYDDAIVGSWFYDHGQVDEGGAFLYMGSAAGLATTPAWTGESNQAGAIYGYRALSAGDLNGDGFGDVVVGARRWDGVAGAECGRAYVYYGSAAGLSASAGWSREGEQAKCEFGSSEASAGDLNGDGYGDLVVATFRWDGAAGTDAGRAQVFYGSPSGVSTPGWTVEGGQAGMWFGYHVASAGDVNHDGFGDLIVGAAEYDAGGLENSGRAYVYLGSAAGLATTPVWTLDGDQAHAELGNAISPAGDVDRDGYDDVLIGALYRSNGAVDSAGLALLFYGSADPSQPKTAVDVAAGRELRLAVRGANPFMGDVRLGYTLPAAAPVRLTIHDLSGRLVATLASGRQEAGEHTVAWAGSAARRSAVGIAFARLEAAGAVRTIKLVRLN